MQDEQVAQAQGAEETPEVPEVFGLLVGFLIFAVRAATGHGLHFGIIVKAAVLGFVVGVATEGFSALVDRIRRQ